MIVVSLPRKYDELRVLEDASPRSETVRHRGPHSVESDSISLILPKKGPSSLALEAKRDPESCSVVGATDQTALTVRLFRASQDDPPEGHDPLDVPERRIDAFTLLGGGAITPRRLASPTYSGVRAPGFGNPTLCSRVGNVESRILVQ